MENDQKLDLDFWNQLADELYGSLSKEPLEPTGESMTDEFFARWRAADRERCRAAIKKPWKPESF